VTCGASQRLSREHRKCRRIWGGVNMGPHKGNRTLPGVPSEQAGALAESFAITVVVPCLNEEDNVDTLYDETVAELRRYADLEVLFVDDGSIDGTLDRIRQ